MATRFNAALVRKNGCFFLNDKLPCIDYDKQRNQVRIEIYKQGITYRCTARRVAIFLHTGQLPPQNQAVYVTCTNFNCVNPLHLRVSEAGERSRVKNSKRDCRKEELKRRLNRSGGDNKSGGDNRTATQPYRVEIYSETVITSNPEKIPEWAKYPDAINVKAETID